VISEEQHAARKRPGQSRDTAQDFREWECGVRTGEYYIHVQIASKPLPNIERSISLLDKQLQIIDEIPRAVL
jgi:hypothetical protein